MVGKGREDPQCPYIHLEDLLIELSTARPLQRRVGVLRESGVPQMVEGTLRITRGRKYNHHTSLYWREASQPLAAALRCGWLTCGIQVAAAWQDRVVQNSPPMVRARTELV